MAHNTAFRAQVYDRVSESGAIIAEWTGKACPREALGVIAAPRGSMTGTVSLATPDGPRQLDDAVYAIPGDPEECSRLRFASSRARYVVVVEKDTVFTRLLDDRFTRLLPCLLITACGYPSLAVRALVQHVVKALALPCVVLTDYNPHGMALMLCYKHGSVSRSPPTRHTLRNKATVLLVRMSVVCCALRPPLRWTATAALSSSGWGSTPPTCSCSRRRRLRLPAGRCSRQLPSSRTRTATALLSMACYAIRCVAHFAIPACRLLATHSEIAVRSWFSRRVGSGEAKQRD